MSVVINTRTAALSDAQIEAWRDIPVSIAVDLEASRQIDYAIRPQTLGATSLHLFGRAVTAQVTPPDFGAVVHALDHVQAGDVLVIAAGGETDFAMIGDILGGHLRNIGCAGLVVDGAVRDIDTLGSWIDFPVFARAVNPRGPTGAADGELNSMVTVGGCTITPGDLIIGDRDGLIALSPDLVLARIDDAKAKLKAEETWVAGLKAGKTAAEVFGL
jgi:regulator of RNase E activity RraA